MRTHQTRPLTHTYIAPSSLRVPKRVARLRLWGKYRTRISLCILSILCVSVVSVALGKITTETQGTLRSHRGLSLSVVDRPPTTVILVRHAEKAIVPPENKDPDLSLAGIARAQELMRMFGDAGIGAIYATQFKRTQQTVKPLADKLGIPVTQVEAKKTTELVKQIRAQNAGQVIFIAGHNNTVPEIIAALGGPQLPIIPETEFDNLYILTAQSDGSAKLLKLRYGPTLPSDSHCNTTKPNGNTPPGERPSLSYYGNGVLWTALWPDGTVVFKPRGPGFVLRNGSLKMKFPWWRSVSDKLTIEGRRLDGSAMPLRASIGKADRKDLVPTYLIFPTQGCWEVTGKAGTNSLTFVTRVIKVG